jgi:hypothetical protein
MALLHEGIDQYLCLMVLQWVLADCCLSAGWGAYEQEL